MAKHSINKKFKKEVLDLGAEACLPVNLSDYWIRALDDELNSDTIARDTEDAYTNMSISILAVVAIVNAKFGGGCLFLSVFADLRNKLKEYRTEVALEIFRRRTNIKCETATMTNIFTNRSIDSLKT